MKKTKPKLKLWRLENDSVIHTILAFSAAGALGLFVQGLVEWGWEWPTTQPEVNEIPPDKLLKIDWDGEVIETTAKKWAKKFYVPEYLSCSEY